MEQRDTYMRHLATETSGDEKTDSGNIDLKIQLYIPENEHLADG